MDEKLTSISLIPFKDHRLPPTTLVVLVHEKQEGIIIQRSDFQHN